MTGADASGAVDLTALSAALETVVRQDRRPVTAWDSSSCAVIPLSPLVASAPQGLMPPLLFVGEAVWREVRHRGYGFEILRDDDALVGLRVTAVSGAPIEEVLASMMAALEASAEADRFYVPWHHLMRFRAFAIAQARAAEQAREKLRARTEAWARHLLATPVEQHRVAFAELDERSRLMVRRAMHEARARALQIVLAES